MSAAFLDRFNRDKCNYGMSYKINSGSITGVTVTANGNTCSAPIPVTIPSAVGDTKSFQAEKIGSDPQTIWVQLSGSPVTFGLSTPIPL